MKNRLFNIIILTLVSLILFSVGASAQEFLPDEKGEYTVELSLQPNNLYVLIALDGQYDETNYIEAYNNSADEDILYFSSVLSDSEGVAKFGPFVPNYYSVATLILSGVGMDIPSVAGYLLPGEAQTVGSLQIVNVEDEYTVNGYAGEDIVIDVGIKAFDSFGFESTTEQTPEISLKQAVAGVLVDKDTGMVTIDRMSHVKTFTIVATLGNVTGEKNVTVMRNTPSVYSIKAYSDVDCLQEISNISVVGIENVFSPVTVYAKSFDQFGDEISDTYSYEFDGNPAQNTFTPDGVGSYTFKINSSVEGVDCSVCVDVSTRSDYTDNALALYNLIVQCEGEIVLDGKTKFISTQNGRDVYADQLWITQTAYSKFETAIAKAKGDLESFDNALVEDTDLEESIVALQRAENTYIDSFTNGSRVDALSIEIKEKDVRLDFESSANERVKQLTVLLSPSNNTEKITWESSDESIATVDENGKVCAVSNGRATITAKTRNGLIASIEVVSYRQIRTLQVSDSKLTLEYGQEPYKLSIIAYPNNHTDTITWTTSNPSVAVVDDNGLVTALSKGKATITATSLGGKTSSCQVEVVLPDWMTAKAPVANIQGGNIYKGAEISLTTETQNAKIYYTLDGSEPNVTSRVYTVPFPINGDWQLKAVAIGEDLFDSPVVTYDFKISSPKVSVGDYIIRQGETVEIDVNIECVQDVSSFTFTLDYDNTRFDYVKASPKGLFASCSVQESEGKITFEYTGESLSTIKETVATVTLNARNDAPEQNYNLDITVVSAKDSQQNDILFETDNGLVTVDNYVVGDVNRDGVVDSKDVVVLAEFCAGKAGGEQIVLVCADVTQDGKIDIGDVILLAQKI